jgi:hypothetical protein
MLDIAWEYYLKNQEWLAKEHPGKEVVIVGESFWGYFDSIEEAYRAAIKEHKVGTFLIQSCVSGREAITQVLNRVII